MSRWFIILVAFLLVLSTAQPAAAATTYPSSITALGDSITTAYDSGGFGNNFANSWSTGTNPFVNSLYLRILAAHSRIRGKNTNLAVSGAKMVNLNAQASQVARRTEYITILMGANDVCTPSVATMTDAATFQSQFDTAMQTLSKKAPKARIYVLSIPDIYNLWSILKDNSSARTAWSLFNICQSMLANPLSTAQADIDRRNTVREHNLNLNLQLQQVCAAYSQCTFDNNAVFNTAFVASDVSTIDYFHPSLSGQTKLAAVAWTASGLAGP
jgi:lysophospholipase L1-like esterase